MNPTRKTDESFYRLFSASHTVSEHLTKREDSELRDKYDHNAFCYYSQPSADEVRAALAYQKERGDTFLKLEGYEPLADAFGMECEETLTMVLPPETDIRSWKTNPDVSIKAPDADQLEQHELKYYGPLYGDDFTVRNNRNLREKLTYLGAYLGGKLENPSLKDIGYVLGVQPFDCTPFYNASLDFADKTVKNFNFLFSGAIFMLDSFVNENLFNQSI